MKQIIIVPLTLLGFAIVAIFIFVIVTDVDTPRTAAGEASLEMSSSYSQLELSTALARGVDDRRKGILDPAQGGVPWWEDKEFLLLAADEFLLQMAEVNRELEIHAQKTTGDASLRRSLFLGADLLGRTLSH